VTANWTPGRLVPANLVTEIKAADAAANAARAVPGVVRLQPGVLGLLRHFAAQAWTQATGRELPDIAGVDADLTRGQLRIDVRVVVSVFYQAAEVGAAVQQAVTAALADLGEVDEAGEVGDEPARIRVHIVEIDLEPNRRP
jgi:hypothetical protein